MLDSYGNIVPRSVLYNEAEAKSIRDLGTKLLREALIKLKETDMQKPDSLVRLLELTSEQLEKEYREKIAYEIQVAELAIFDRCIAKCKQSKERLEKSGCFGQSRVAETLMLSLRSMKSKHPKGE